MPEIFGYCKQDTRLFVIQELASFGTLKTVAQTKHVAKLWTLPHELCASVQLALALEFLEYHHVVHADLSCRNVLCCCLHEDVSRTSVKLSDFGLSVLLQPDCQEVTINGAEFAILADAALSECRQQPRPVRWCSPETVAQHRLSFRSDVWSFGALLWEMFAGGTDPWMQIAKRADVTAKLKQLAALPTSASCGAHDASAWALARDFPRMERCPPDVYLILQRMMNPDEFERPRAEQLTAELRSCSAAQADACKLHLDTVSIDGEEWALIGGSERLVVSC